MNRLASTLLLVLACATLPAMAQDDDPDNANIGIAAGYFDNSSGSDVDYSTFKMPPLDVLFTNARTNPTIEMLEREERIAKSLLRKEKLEFLTHITGRGSYTYGSMDNYASNSNVATPIFYQYAGSKQNYWNVGASISFSVEDLLDIKGKIKRKRLQYEKTGLEKDKAFEDLKLQIINLYVAINNDLIALKTAAENASSYRAAGMKTTAEFYTNEVTVRDLAETKRWESTSVMEYQRLLTLITTNILTLEVLTHTPIITNVTNQVHADDDDD